jgi:chitinase
LQDNSGTNLYGCLKQFYLLKKQNPNLKVLLSIGGWTYSSNFAGPASTSTGRSTFALSAISLVKNLGLDRLDIDWEYPADDTEAVNFVLLLQAVREALDAYSKTLNPPYHFQLTVACPAGPENYQRLHLSDMNLYLDFWNLMAYDYAGKWSPLTSNQANLFSSETNPTSTPFDTEKAVKYYLSQNISTSKIVLGMPLYGRSFELTEGLGLPFNGVGPGSWEAGAYDFKVLPLDGALEYYDNITGSSFSYDGIKKELISYDTVASVKKKVAWIQAMGLGGAMWWESSADRVGDQSLIRTVANILGGENGSGLERIPNKLVYLNSTYDNLREGMSGSELVNSTCTTSQESQLNTELFPTTSLEGTPSTSTYKSLSFTTPAIVQGCSTTSTFFNPEKASLASDIPSSRSISTPITATTCTTSSSHVGSLSKAGSVSETTALSTELTQSTTTSLALVPGTIGVAGYSYILVSNFVSARCSSDYCNRGGTVASLLTSSSVSGTLTRTCNYPTQPVADSYVPHFNSSTTTTTTTIKPLVSKFVYIVCPASSAMSEPCKTVSTAFSTTSAL